MEAPCGWCRCRILLALTAQSSVACMAALHLTSCMVQGRKGMVKAEKTPEEVKALEQFNVITEAASALMDAGEMDIYSAVREELQRAAEKDADEDDMFADADEGGTDQVRAASCTGAMHTSELSLALSDKYDLWICMLVLAL